MKKPVNALVLILLPTLVVWQGVWHSGFTPDDYYVIDWQSPIASFTDAISMFWRVDPNPQYWRPLTNSTVSVDFWLWGWNGGMFHVTNLVLHLVATTLVYFFLLRICKFQQQIALVVTAFFGIAACHDANLLWIAARSDVIVTIMMLATMLAAYKAQATKRLMWQAISVLCFLASISSKEVAWLTLALLPLLVWSDSLHLLWQKKWQIVKLLLPYLIIGTLFFAIRMQFTVPLTQMQPVEAEGSRSLIAFLKNALYSIGYVVVPVSFHTASTIINRFLMVGFILAGASTLITLFIFWKYGRQYIPMLYKPIVLIIVTGLVSFQSFERWRVYFPSVGVFVIIALLILILWKIDSVKWLWRSIAVLFGAALLLFNIWQANIKQEEWALATEMIDGYKGDFRDILSRHTERPITLNLITSPIKLGDAQLIQLSSSYLPRKAEAERLQEPRLAIGSLGDAPKNVHFFSNLNVYALDPAHGFGGLIIERQDSVLHVSMSPSAKLAFAPNTPVTEGVARRDRTYQQGTVHDTYGATITVNKAEGSFIKDATIDINDTLGIPIFFDGEHIRELK